MTFCAACGMQLADGASLCSHHATGFDDGWARTNRIMCDLLHRGIAVARLSAVDRDALVLETTEEPAAAAAAA